VGKSFVHNRISTVTLLVAAIGSNEIKSNFFKVSKPITRQASAIKSIESIEYATDTRGYREKFARCNTDVLIPIQQEIMMMRKTARVAFRSLSSHLYYAKKFDESESEQTD